MSNELVRELEACEAVIERGMQTFVEVGQALLKIRDKELYRQEYSNFESYCQERWNFNRSVASKMITAASVTSDLVSHVKQLPTNARQAYELSRVPEPERAEVWRETLERTDGKPTARALRETYEAAKEPSTPPRTSVVEPTAVIPPEKGDDPDSPDKIMMDLMKQFIDIREKANNLTAAKIRRYPEQHVAWRRILGDHMVVIKSITDKISEAK